MDNFKDSVVNFFSDPSGNVDPVKLAGGAFVFAIAVAFLINTLGIGDSVTFIALLLVPMIVYGVASGQIQEFSAPGWTAKFKEKAHAHVSTQLEIQTFDMIPKGGPEQLRDLSVKGDKPIALTFQFGQRGYQVNTARQYIKSLLPADQDLTVLILDSEKHFVAMVEGVAMLWLLSIEERAQKIINALIDNDKAYILKLPGFHANSIKPTDSVAAALAEMRANHSRSLVVVESDKPIGVVRRDDIISKLVESLATPSK